MLRLSGSGATQLAALEDLVALLREQEREPLTDTLHLEVIREVGASTPTGYVLAVDTVPPERRRSCGEVHPQHDVHHPDGH